LENTTFRKLDLFVLLGPLERTTLNHSTILWKQILFPKCYLSVIHLPKNPLETTCFFVFFFFPLKRLEPDFNNIHFGKSTELKGTSTKVSCAMNLRETRVQLQAELLDGQNSIRVGKVVVELLQRTANTPTPVAQTTGRKQNTLCHTTSEDLPASHPCCGRIIGQEALSKHDIHFIIHFHNSLLHYQLTA
jgi:hypothetical protein